LCNPGTLPHSCFGRGKSRIGSTLLPTPGCGGAAAWGAAPAFVLIRGGFRATFFHLDVPEFFSQATAASACCSPRARKRELPQEMACCPMGGWHAAGASLHCAASCRA